MADNFGQQQITVYPALNIEHFFTNLTADSEKGIDIQPGIRDIYKPAILRHHKENTYKLPSVA